MRQTILVVDDQPQVRRLLRMILDRDGYSVLEAEAESSAVAATQGCGRKIDLAVIDIGLPGPSGREVAATLSRLGVSETVFITGLDPNELLADGRLDVGDPLVRKPFTVAAVARAVKSILKPPPRPIV